MPGQDDVLQPEPAIQSRFGLFYEQVMLLASFVFVLSLACVPLLVLPLL